MATKSFTTTRAVSSKASSLFPSGANRSRFHFQKIEGVSGLWRVLCA